MTKDKAWPEIEARIEKEDGQLIAYAEKYLQWLYAVDDYLGDEIDPARSALVTGKIAALEEILSLARCERK
jgi:hypothetical protein